MLWAVALVIAAIAVLAFVAGASAMRRASAQDEGMNEMVERGVSTSAMVVELDSSVSGSGSDSTTYWHPVVEFTTHNGEAVRARTMNGSTPAPARVGQRVQVRYLPERPDRVLLEGVRRADPRTETGGWRVIGCGLIGFAVLLCAMAVLVGWIAMSTTN